MTLRFFGTQRERLLESTAFSNEEAEKSGVFSGQSGHTEKLELNGSKCYSKNKNVQKAFINLLTARLHLNVKRKIYPTPAGQPPLKKVFNFKLDTFD